MTTTPLPDPIPGRAREIRAVLRAQRRGDSAANAYGDTTPHASVPAPATAAQTPSTPTERRVPPTRSPKTDPRRTRP